MHKVTVSIQGAANDYSSVEVSDAEALPLYVRLRDVLGEGKPTRRRKNTGTSLPQSPAAEQEGGPDAYGPKEA